MVSVIGGKRSAGVPPNVTNFLDAFMGGEFYAPANQT